MRKFSGQFEDAALEAAFRADASARLYWVITAPWIAGAVVVLTSIFLAYLRLGFTEGFFLVACARAALCALILNWAWRLRSGVSGFGYYAAAISLLLGVLTFNITAVGFGSTDWVRISRSTIIEMFVITLSLMVFSRDAWWGLATLWVSHLGLGLVSFAADYVQLFNEMLVVTLAALVGAVLCWRFSISERDAYLNRQQLRQARKDAEAAATAKAKFLANMSHEIRTPMTGILGMLDIALDRDQVSQELGRDLTEVKACATSLLAILNDVLDYSKIESEGLKLDPVVAETLPMIRQAESLFRATAQDKGVALSTECHNLPEHIEIDAVRFGQVLTNLVGNALKFTSVGRVTIRASWLDLNEHRGQLRIEVTDTGIGIPQEACSRLFQRFAQAEADTSRRFGGTGLGLSISKEIVDAMQGEIGVDSVEGAGSTFWCQLPCRTATAADAARQDEPADRAPPNQLKLLVADDNPINRKIVAAYLRKAGHTATLVDDGEAAVQALEAQPFDAILMDVNMPKLDGVGATRAIRRLDEPRARTPIIALTANTMEGEREALLDAGMDDYLAKPVDQAQLLSALAKFGPCTP
ncbi:MAG: ATP-binding protein [Pseudomonadota bacterium]